MPLISEIIMAICMASNVDKCVEKMHVCMRDNFQVNFYDQQSWQQELVLPVQIEWCEEQVKTKAIE